MLCKSRAIVIHHIKYGGSSLIVTLYAEKYGRISCIINGVRNTKSKIPAGLFQPLNLLELDIYYRQNREIQRIKEALCLFPCSNIPFHIHKNTIALFLAEVLYKSLHEEESNPSLFNFLYQAIQLLNDLKEGISSFHLWFMLHFTRYIGIFPTEYNHILTDKLLPELQMFYALSTEAKRYLISLLSSPMTPPINVSITNIDRNLLLDSIIQYYILHLEGFSTLKSYAVLHEVFK
jgi:DNA repair protein RecO (recombination protein O)